MATATAKASDYGNTRAKAHAGACERRGKSDCERQRPSSASASTQERPDTDASVSVDCDGPDVPDSLSVLLGIESWEEVDGANECEDEDLPDCSESLPSIDEVLADAARMAQQNFVRGAAARRPNPNALIGTYAYELMTLAAPLGCIAHAAGPDGAEGLINPRQTFKKEKVKGFYEDVPQDTLEQIHDAIEELSKLWEECQSMQVLPLAKNVLVWVVLSDEVLRGAAMTRALAWLTQMVDTVQAGKNKTV